MIESLKPFALLTGLMVAGIIGLAAFGFGIGLYDFEERDIYAYHPAANGTDISVYNRNGDINVYTWDDPSNQTVQVKAHMWTLSGKTALDKVSIRFTAGVGLKIESYIEDGGQYSIFMDLTVYVPNNTDIIKIETDNGNVKMVGCHGNATIENSNGPVTVRDHAGTLNIETSNGQINVKGLNGGVSAKSSNDKITIAQVEGDVTAKTDNGAISMTAINGSVSGVTSNARIDMNGVAVLVKAVTDNGDISIRAQNISASGAKVETSNDDVNIYLPLDMKIRLDMQTDNGNAAVHNFAVLYEKDEGGYKLGDVNGGGPRLEIDTDNGDIDVWGVA